MAKSLLESYKNRLSISEAVHQKTHNGAKMNSNKKLMIAAVLDNTARFMNEAFDSSAAMQRSALGDFKKFCLNVSTVALPNLILPELMLTQPMTSISGYVTYLRYTAGTAKGAITENTIFNDPYKYGKMNEDRVNYTSQKVVELVDAEATEIAPAWTPVVGNKVIGITAANAEETIALDENGKATVDAAKFVKIKYEYDNVVIPQNKIATLKAEMTSIDLHAHARRIAVYYSQIAAFQAKTDYGYDIAEMLSNQAQGELAYEIDTEGVMLLDKGAELNKTLKFESYEMANQNTYISRSQYYEMFNEIISRAKKVIYDRTQKFAPNYMVIGTNVLTIMPYVKGWTAAPASTINGPFYAGTVDGLKVYCSPAIDQNKFFFGVNGNDLQTAAAVYAPYMAVVPTQLLGFADGGMSQGFSTMYDMKLLSTYNRDAQGNKVDTIGARPASEVASSEIGQYSYLLVAGMFVTNNNDKVTIEAAYAD